jgi:hypothetical protein
VCLEGYLVGTAVLGLYIELFIVDYTTVELTWRTMEMGSTSGNKHKNYSRDEPMFAKALKTLQGIQSPSKKICHIFSLISV